MAEQKENREVAKAPEDVRVVQIPVPAGYRLVALVTNGARVDMARTELTALELHTVGEILARFSDQLMAQASKPEVQEPPAGLKLAEEPNPEEEPVAGFDGQEIPG